MTPPMMEPAVGRTVHYAPSAKPDADGNVPRNKDGTVHAGPPLAAVILAHDEKSGESTLSVLGNGSDEAPRIVRCTQGSGVKQWSAPVGSPAAAEASKSSKTKK